MLFKNTILQLLQNKLQNQNETECSLNHTFKGVLFNQNFNCEFKLINILYRSYGGQYIETEIITTNSHVNC